MLTVGASHRTATNARLGDFGQAAQAFRASVRDGVHVPSGAPIHELAVLSTCARVEVYAVTDDSALDDTARILGREVFGGEVGSTLDGTPYSLRGPEAVRHLCRVASGLESFVVGEHEIAGQVTRAFKDAVRVSVDAKVLEGVAAAARAASGRVRSETGIGRYPASVSSVAVDLVRERLGDLAERRAVVVGAGSAARLVARALRSSGVASLIVANRSVEHARDVAEEIGGEGASLGCLPELLVDADVVFSATGADEVVIDDRMASQALRDRRPGGRPLLIVDLALPADVAPEVAALPALEVLTLDDVRERVRRHISFRREKVGAAERLVDEVVEDFLQKQEGLDVDAAIGELRRSVEAIRSAEVDRWMAARRADVPPTRDELDRLTRSVVNKLLHDPMKRLRSASSRG